MKVIEAPVYRSDDGLREFKSQDECIEYEKFILLRAIIHKHARGIVYQAEVANFILKAWSEISLAMQHNGEACAIESALQPGWRDVESAPKDGRVVLLGKFNSHNKWRTMRGQWFSADAIAETWEDPDDAPEGWYETSVEAEDMPNVWYTEPTHWMPLPPAPKATK